MKIAPIMLTCMLLLSGCSYREFDDRLQSGINDYIQTEPTMPTVINEDGEAVEVTTLQSEWEADINIKYVPVGEQFSDYYAYNDSYGTYDGTEGLSFRVDSVTVYDSVYESEIPIEEIREYALDNFADRAKFIVADITGEYQNPTGESANNSIICRFMWNSAVRYGADYEYYSKYDDSENANCSDVCYFSECPHEGDINALTGKEFDPDMDFYTFKTPLVSGEEFSFKIGMFYQQTLIDDKNVYLAKYSKKPSESGDAIVFVDLLGRFDNDQK